MTDFNSVLVKTPETYYIIEILLPQIVSENVCAVTDSTLFVDYYHSHFIIIKTI